MTDANLSASRRGQLFGMKLRALVAEHTGAVVTAEPETMPHGAALLDGTAAWVLFDGDASRSLGAALAWAVRRNASSLDIVADAGGGVVARRGAAFSLPIAVWFAEGRTLLPVVAEPLPPSPPATDEHLAFAPMIERAGAELSVEHGIVAGEVRGLEVCRVVDEPTVGFLTESGVDPQLDDSGRGGLQLEVGVGAADREAFQMLHGDMPTPAALETVVAAVALHRTADGGQHPLNRLGRERFLRWHATRHPETVGLVDLVVAEPPVPRPNLKDPIPCVAAGTEADGSAVTVVFTSGVDLELLPYVADVQAASDQPVRVALPGRDLLAVIEEIAALLVEPIGFVTLDA